MSEEAPAVIITTETKKEYHVAPQVHGNAAPLGMNAFALTLFVFSLMNAGGLVSK